MARVLNVKAFSGCHNTKSTVLTIRYNQIRFVSWFFASLGISSPRKKASSRKEGNINRVTGRMNTILLFRSSGSNSPEKCPIPRTRRAYTGKGSSDFGDTVNGEVFKPVTIFEIRQVVIFFIVIDIYIVFTIVIVVVIVVGKKISPQAIYFVIVIDQYPIFLSTFSFSLLNFSICSDEISDRQSLFFLTHRPSTPDMVSLSGIVLFFMS